MAVPFDNDPTHWGVTVVYAIEIALTLLLFRFLTISPIITFTVRQLCHPSNITSSALRALCMDTQDGSLLYQEPIIPCIVMILIRLGVVRININNIRQTLLITSVLGLIICGVPFYPKLIQPAKVFDDLLLAETNSCACEANTSTTEKEIFPIGIDVGTSFMRIVHYDRKDNEFRRYFSRDSFPTFSTNRDDSGNVVRFTESKEHLWEKNPSVTVHSIKRFLGNDWKSVYDNSYYTFGLDESGGNVVLQRPTGHSSFDTVYDEWAAFLVSGIERVEEHSGKKVTHVVVAIPSSFGYKHRQFAKKLIVQKFSDINIKFITEATAAAIAFGRKNDKINGNIMVFDMGAGKLDLTILSRERLGVFSVIATGGTLTIGGDDLVSRCVHQNPKLASDSADAKMKISAAKKCEETIIQDTKSLKFDFLTKDMIDSILKHVEEVVKYAGTKDNIQHVWFTGGSSKLSKIQDIVKNYFKENKQVNYDMINDVGIVAEGAACMATRFSGISVPGFTHFFDVTHQALGTDILNKKKFSIIIPKNYRIPAKISTEYVTATDNQDVMGTAVFEGDVEDSLTKDLTVITNYQLSNLSPAPAQKVLVLHTLEINSEGNLILTTEEKKNDGGEKNIKIVIEEDYVSPVF